MSEDYFGFLFFAVCAVFVILALETIGSLLYDVSNSRVLRSINCVLSYLSIVAVVLVFLVFFIDLLGLMTLIVLISLFLLLF